MTPGEQSVNQQVDALLATYKAAKDEIGRRSTLSWTAAGANLAFVLAAFRAVLDNNDWRIWAWAVCTWPIACLTYQFYLREHGEVFRLSAMIKDEIEPRLGQLLGADGHRLLLEGEDPRGVWEITGLPQRIADYGIFLLGPAAVTASAIGILAVRCEPQPLLCLSYVLTAIGATIIGLCATILIRWLYKYCRW
jgi:hypothetical protein